MMKYSYQQNVSPVRLHRRLSLWHRVGKPGGAILLFGTILIGAAFGLLAFFWWSSGTAIRGGSPSFVWNRIVDAGRAARTVTLASALIRTSVALQAGLLTAMMASIIIETSEVRVSKLAKLSSMRSFNIGPITLASSALRRSLGKTPFWCMALIALTLVVSIATQFTSTILLIDFNNEVIVLGKNSSRVVFGLNYAGTNGGYDVTNGVNYWRSRPNTYPRFAEYAEGPKESNGVQDTGLTYRAMLPFNSEAERGSLRNFTGITKVMDARYVCVRPKFQNLVIAPLDDDTTYRTLSGTVSLDASSDMLEPMENVPSIRTVDFNCKIILPNSVKYWENDYGRNSICMIPPMANLKSSIAGNTDPSTYTMLILNTTGTQSAWPMSGSLEGLTPTGYKSWNILRSADEQVNLGASLCFGNSDSPSNFRVNMWSRNDYQEPYPQWDNSSSQWITSPIVDLDCASCSDVADRERMVLHLENPTNSANWSAAVVNSTAEFGVMDSPYIWLGVEQGFVYDNPLNNTMLMSFGIQQRVHKAHIAVYGDVLRNTGNPALALQTLFTILAQMAYYDWLSVYDIDAPADFVLSAQASIPSQWTGFTVVGALLALHLLLVTVVFALFGALTEVSLLGNAWAAMAQVGAGETKDILDLAVDMKDKEVEKMLAASGRNITVHGLSRLR